MLLTLCTFLQAIHQTINALNDIQFMTRIKLLHVSAHGCHSQEIFQIKGIEAQHTNVRIASPSQEGQKYYLITYFVCYLLLRAVESFLRS
jgi:hypothetical protein